MDKKNKKRVGKIAAAVVLVLLFLGSCSPSYASAADLTGFAKSVFESTRFSDWVSHAVNNVIDTISGWTFGDYDRSFSGSHGGGGRSRSLAYGDALSVDFSGGGSSGVVSPMYTFNGKIRLDYTNGNYEIINTAISFTSNYNVVSGGSYTGIDNYTTLDFGRSNTNLPTVGTWFFVRLAYNSAGELIDSSNFAFCFDQMPFPSIFSNGDYGFRPRSTSGTYYNNSGIVTRSYMNDNTVRFYNNATTNSIAFRSGLDWSSRYSDLAFVHTDYSLIYYYSSLATSNNDDFISLVNTRSNPSLTAPVVKIGIGARTVINESNVNNYNSFSYDNDTIIYNYDNYVSNYTSYDENIIKAAINTIYGNQPAPGESFDSPIRYDYIVTAPLTSDYLPSEWLYPFPSIQLQPNLDVELPSIPQYDIDSNVADRSIQLLDVGKDFFDASGLLPVMLFFAVAGILFLFLD